MMNVTNYIWKINYFMIDTVSFPLTNQSYIIYLIHGFLSRMHTKCKSSGSNGLKRLRLGNFFVSGQMKLIIIIIIIIIVIVIVIVIVILIVIVIVIVIVITTILFSGKSRYII